MVYQRKREFQKFMDLNMSIFIPLNNITPRIIIWSKLWEITFLHISAVIKLSNLEYGFLKRS